MVIANGATLELASALEESVIGDLSLRNGTLTGVGTVLITDSLLSWEGTMSGSGSTILRPGASCAQSSSTAYLNGRSFVNEGQYSLINEAHLEEQEGAKFTNTGTFLANSTAITDIGNRGVGASPTFVNDGTLEKTSGNSNALVTVYFANEGSVEVAYGSLDFGGGGSSGSAASWSASEGSFIEFRNYGVSVVGSSFAGKLMIGSMQGGQVFSVENLATVPAEIDIAESLGTLSVPKGTLTIPQLTNNGTLTGAGTIVVTRSLGGSGKMTGSGSTVLRPAVSFTQNWTTVLISERTLVNEGEYTLTNEAELREENGAKFENKGTFLANSQVVVDVEDLEMGAKPTFVNRGVVKKTGGFSVAVIQPLFYNYGRIYASYGKIDIKHPSEPDQRTRYGASNHSMIRSRRAACGDPVECLTGNFYESQADIAVDGRGIGLELVRVYNAQAAAADEHGSFGYGWSSSFSDHLIANPSEHLVMVVQANGSTVPFSEEGGSLQPPAWSQDTLTGNTEAGYVLTLADQTAYKFSGTGGLESVADRNGNTTSLGYNEADQLVTITDPSGQTIKLAYNGEGLVESATDPMGHVVKYSYEGGNLASVMLPGESSPRWRFAYDSSHRIIRMINGLGGETTNEYNSTSQVISQKNPLGDVTKWEYEPFATKITNEATHATTLDEYGSNFELLAVTYAYGTEQETTDRYTYDEAGDTLSETNGAGDTTSYEYNSEGNKIKQTDPEGHEKKWTYNSEHEVTSETLPSGETTTIEYDEHGNPIKVSRPAPEEKTQETRYEYNSRGEMTAMIDPLGAKWGYEYDEAGDRTSETNPEGDKTTWGYNEDSQQTSEVSPAGNVEGGSPGEYMTSIERNVLGQPVKVTKPEGQETSYEYNADGDQTTVTDANGHKTTVSYSSEDQPIKVTQPSGAVQETEYDGAGQIVKQTDGNKHATTYVRNVLGQVTETVNPLEGKTTETYDAAGNLASVTSPEGLTTSYSYSKENQLSKISYSEAGAHAVEYEYTPDGQLASMSDGTGTTSYVYDQLGRLIETKDGHGAVVGYGYDLANEITQITYPNGKTVKDGYDKAGRLSSVSDWLSHTTSFSYTPNSQVATEDLPEASGESDHYAYTRAGQLVETTMLKGSETLASLVYKRDKLGQLTKATQTGLPGLEAMEYAYNTNEQLESAGSTGYEYDPAGNPTKIGAASNTFNAADELTEGGGTTYAYNLAGERTKATPTSGPATAYGYDQAGNLTSIARPEEGATQKIEDAYAYNGNNLRTSETTGGTTHYLTWQLSSTLPRLLSDGTDSYIYGPEGPVEQINNEEELTYLHHDQAGSTRLLTSSTGAVVGSYTYTPYGATEGHTGTATTPLGFDGQYTSSDTGLIYLRARSYDPATAQFMSTDPMEEWTHEPYTYAGDNPINRSDPFGLFPWEAIAEGLGVGASCLLGPEVCVPVGLGVIDYHVISADISSAETGCSPWPSIVPALVAGGVSTLPFGGGIAAKDVWEASRTAFRIGATGGIASGALAGTAAASNNTVSCGC